MKKHDKPTSRRSVKGACATHSRTYCRKVQVQLLKQGIRRRRSRRSQEAHYVQSEEDGASSDELVSIDDCHAHVTQKTESGVTRHGSVSSASTEAEEFNIA